MSDLIAWAAGVFEGESCVYVTQHHGSERWYPNATIGMTDRDILVRLQSILGGTLGDERAPHGTAKKLTSRWGVYGWDAVAELHAQIGPWLGERRSARFAEILALRPAPYSPGGSGVRRRTVPRDTPIPLTTLTSPKRAHEYVGHARLGPAPNAGQPEN